MKRTQDIYRLEDSAGIGPYQSDTYYALPQSVQDHLIWQNGGEGLHCPPPAYDGGFDCDSPRFHRIVENNRAKYGCASIASLHDWFQPDVWQSLSQHGYTVHHYVVPASKVLVGKHQVIYDSTAAKESPTV